MPRSADADGLAMRVKARRLELGLTQTVLAERLGVSHSAISQIESGKTRRTHQLLPLSHALSVQPHWLATGEGTMLAAQSIVSEQACRGCRDQGFAPLLRKLERLSPAALRQLCATADALLADSRAY